MYHHRSAAVIRNFILLLLFTMVAALSGQSEDISYLDEMGLTVQGIRCATAVPDALEMERVRSEVFEWAQRNVLDAEPNAIVSIPVAFHVIRNDAGTLYDVTDQQILDQIDVMNAGFASTNFQFSLHSIERVDNTDWSTHSPGTADEIAMKSALAVEPTTTLNFYTGNLGGGLLGYATFPWSYAEDSALHGVVCLYSSLPGGTAVPYNLGATATHEVGHYVGLYHTFQNGCQSPGDEVDDTPYEAAPNYGCPDGVDSCPADPGDDPVTNYMDYTDDICMDHFTADQSTRSDEMMALYRPAMVAAGSVDTPPTITSSGNTTAVVDLAYSYDADNTVSATGTAPITFSLVSGPAGFGVDASGLVTWTPTAGQLGSHSVEIMANNDFGGDSEIYTVDVVETPPPSDDILVNSAGPDYTAANGDLFVADFGFSGGASSSTSSSVSGTSDEALYQTYREGTNFSYAFDVSSGDYDVTCYFVEPRASRTGQRVFDVSGEGSVILNDYDIYGAAGQLAAHSETFTVSVFDGQMNLSFDFVSGRGDPLVSAIRIAGTGPPPPPEPDIAVSPSAVDFGAIVIGATGDAVVTITNSGGAELNVTDLSSSNAVFTLLSPALPFVVAAGGGSEDVTVTFAPTTEGVQGGALDITSDDPDESSVSVDLDGEGVTDVPPPTSAFRINAGGTDFTTGGGVTYDADKAYSSGGFGYSGGSSSSTSADIVGTSDDALYQAYREGDGFSYLFDLDNGDYNVTCYFTEPRAGVVGKRVFDVSAEGSVVIDNLDIYAEVGKITAHSVAFPVSVSDGQLELSFDTASGPGAPLVSAIEVAPYSGRSLAKGSSEIADNIPLQFSLGQNYPNPFNPETRIDYQVPQAMHVNLTIYNMLGQQIKVLANGYQAAGSHRLVWDATDNNGIKVPSGVYIYQLNAEAKIETRKMILLQ